MGLRPGRQQATAAGISETVGGALIATGFLMPVGCALITGVQTTPMLFRGRSRGSSHRTIGRPAGSRRRKPDAAGRRARRDAAPPRRPRQRAARRRAPIVVSRAHYLASDVDKELAEAHERLTAALDWAQAEGLQASGTVGDPNAALGAIEDELRRVAADEHSGRHHANPRPHRGVQE